MTSGRSMAESERHSVPLSAAALPTDCGDWEPENVSHSGHCLEPGSVSLCRHRGSSVRQRFMHRLAGHGQQGSPKEGGDGVGNVCVQGHGM